MVRSSLHRWWLTSALAVLALLAAPTLAAASCSNDPECDDISAWATFTRITLTQSASGSEGTIKWVGSFDPKTLDASINIATHGSQEQMAGTVALVGGQVMLAKGLKLRPGYEIDALDAPVLSMKLVLILMQRIFPKGPDEVVGPKKFDRVGRVGIKYATPSASGYIPAPWHIRGKVMRLPDGTLPFDLALTFAFQGQDKHRSSITIGMKGELAVLGRPVFRDSDSLEGWTTYGLGPQQTKQGGSTTFDYGAKPQEATRFRNIGDIRSFIASENDPGAKDSTKDFTGFWKEKCDEAFGLQIKHYGDDGKLHRRSRSCGRAARSPRSGTSCCRAGNRTRTRCWCRR